MPDPVFTRRRQHWPRSVIEQAKGMFMLLCSWSPDEAFTALREISQHTSVKVHDVAAAVAFGSSTEPPTEDEVAFAVIAKVRRTVLGPVSQPGPPVSRNPETLARMLDALSR